MDLKPTDLPQPPPKRKPGRPPGPAGPYKPRKAKPPKPHKPDKWVKSGPDDKCSDIRKLLKDRGYEDTTPPLPALPPSIEQAVLDPESCQTDEGIEQVIDRMVRAALQKMLVEGDLETGARQAYKLSYGRLLWALAATPTTFAERMTQGYLALGAIRHMETRNLELLNISTTGKDVQFKGMVEVLRGELNKLQEFKLSRRAEAQARGIVVEAEATVEAEPPTNET